MALEGWKMNTLTYSVKKLEKSEKISMDYRKNITYL